MATQGFLRLLGETGDTRRDDLAQVVEDSVWDYRAVAGLASLERAA